MYSNIRFKCEQKPYPIYNSWRYVELYGIMWTWSRKHWRCRSSPPEVLLKRGVPKICSKFTGEHPCRSVISIKLLCSALQLYKNHTSAWVFSCFFIQYILPLPILNKVIMKIIKWHLVKKFTGEYPVFFKHLR